MRLPRIRLIAMTALLPARLGRLPPPLDERRTQAQVRHIFFPAQAEELGDSLSVKSVDERNEHWKSRIPADDTALWNWLTTSTRRTAWRSSLTA